MTDVAKSRKDELFEFYGNLGLCISGWAQVDAFLFRIFRLGTGLDTDMASLLFYKSSSLMEHVSITNEIAKSILNVPKFGHTALSSKWDRTVKRLKNGVEFRNHIAHNPVYSSSEVDFEIYPDFNKEPGSFNSSVPKGLFKLAKEPYRYHKELIGKEKVMIKSSDIVSLEDLEAKVREVYRLSMELNFLEADLDAYRKGQRDVSPEPDMI